ncbi:MAG: zinc finger domain-containing protein, partial [Planctomycetota bacterium]
RKQLEELPPLLTGTRVERVFCKGKHIFVAFDNGVYLHNHLVMRGRWRKIKGRLLMLPEGTWLALYVGAHTVCNLNGQMLKMTDWGGVQAAMDSLGPDIMAEPFPRQAVTEAIAASRLPVAEAILDQSVVCGVGNIAKSEALLRARIDPRASASRLDGPSLRRLVQVLHDLLWESYHQGGRWTCRVYRKRGQPCPDCGHKIQLLRLAPSKRSTYFCPACQGSGGA